MTRKRLEAERIVRATGDEKFAAEREVVDAPVVDDTRELDCLGRTRLLGMASALAPPKSVNEKMPKLAKGFSVEFTIPSD